MSNKSYRNRAAHQNKQSIQFKDNSHTDGPAPNSYAIIVNLAY